MKNNLSLIMGDQFVRISELHQNTGISRSTITGIYYRKNVSVKLSTLVKICDYLQVPLHELIDYDPTAKEN